MDQNQNGYRGTQGLQKGNADGAYGQYIIILPEQDAVVVTTAQIGDMQEEINLIWDNILPALQ